MLLGHFLMADEELYSKICSYENLELAFKKARQGKISEFTGVTAPYEAPESPEVTIDTGAITVERSLRLLIDHVDKNFKLPAD